MKLFSDASVHWRLLYFSNFWNWKKPHDKLLKIRPMMTASNFPFPVDGSLCSREIYFSLRVSEIIIFPGKCLLVPWEGCTPVTEPESSQNWHISMLLPDTEQLYQSEDANLMSKSIGFCKRIAFATVLMVHLCYGLCTRNRNFALERALAHSWMMSSTTSNYYCPQCHTGIKCGK